MKTGEINAIQDPNPMDNYPALDTSIANLKKEQHSDQIEQSFRLFFNFQKYY